MVSKHWAIHASCLPNKKLLYGYTHLWALQKLEPTSEGYKQSLCCLVYAFIFSIEPCASRSFFDHKQQATYVETQQHPSMCQSTSRDLYRPYSLIDDRDNCYKLSNVCSTSTQTHLLLTSAYLRNSHENSQLSEAQSYLL